MKPSAGIFPGISRLEYGRIAAINQSLLKIGLMQSWAHLREEEIHPKDSTPAMIFGEAVHTAILEPARFAREYCAPAMDEEGHRWKKTTKEGKAAWAVWEAANEGKQILDLEGIPHAWTRLHEIQRAVTEQPLTRAILGSRGLSECALVWQDVETTLWCKALVDRIELDRPPCEHLWDLKTTENAHPRAFSLQAAKLGYHIQAAFYMMGARALDPRPRRFGFLLMEKERPFVVAARVCAESVLAQGEAEMRVALRRYAECLAADKWPAYGDEIEEFHLPEWAYREVEENE